MLGVTCHLNYFCPSVCKITALHALQDPVLAMPLASTYGRKDSFHSTNGTDEFSRLKSVGGFIRRLPARS